MSEKQNNKNHFNPVEKIKYFLLEPVKSSADAEARKKELIPYVAVSVSAAFVLIGLGMLIEPIKIVFDILGYIAMAATFLFGWCLFKAISLKKKLAKLECTNCKTIIKYSPDTKIEVTNKRFTISDSRKENPKAGVDITVSGDEYTHVAITCKCQKCGTEKVINEMFVTARCEMRKNAAIINADIVAMELRKIMQAAYDSDFTACPGDLEITKRTDAEKEVIAFFNEDGTAGKTPFGTFSKTKK